MVSFATMLGLLVWVQVVSMAYSVTTFFDDIIPPKVISVTTLQRSGSTTVSRLIASQQCAVWGNEIFVGGGQDVLHGHELAEYTIQEARDNPVQFLLDVNKIVCKSDDIPKECNGRCTIVVKVFDNHLVSEKGMEEMIASPDFGFVVLQRPISEWYSSGYSAWKNNDWDTTPNAKRPERKIFKEEDLPSMTKTRYSTWFDKLRDGLNGAGKLYLEIPFAAVKTCGLFDEILPSVFSFFGMDFEQGVEIKNKWDGDNIESILESCSHVVGDMI